MSYTLLLADDSVTTQRVLELTFAEHGVRVVGVTDGEQALDRLKTEKADIVLADIGLAKVNGYDLAARIKQDPSLAPVPVLLLTGAFDTVDDERVKASGAAGTLVKPLESGFVIKRVKELLGFAGTGPVGTPPARLMTAAEPPPLRPPAGPRGVGPPPGPRPVPPPREAHIPMPPAAWDQLREQSGLAPDNAHVEGQSGADDYFDRLDAAFDSLDAQLAGRPTKPGPAPAAPPRTPAATAPVLPPPVVAPPPAPVPTPAAAAPEPVPTPSPPEEPVFEVNGDWFANAIAAEAAAAPVAPAAPEHRTAPPAPPARLAPAALERVTMVPGGGSGVADAFESLLAAEQGETPQSPAPVIEISDEVIDRIAARVAEHLTEGVLIETVSHIVGAVTERLVKEEIARIRSAARARKPE